MRPGVPMMMGEGAGRVVCFEVDVWPETRRSGDG